MIYKFNENLKYKMKFKKNKMYEKMYLIKVK